MEDEPFEQSVTCFPVTNVYVSRVFTADHGPEIGLTLSQAGQMKDYTFSLTYPAAQWVAEQILARLAGQ